MKTPPSKWKWFGNVGHLIVGHSCRFHMATQIGQYLVSTVGEYWPEDSVLETLAECRGWKLVGKGDERRASWIKQHPTGGFEEIGAGTLEHPALYETMVFKTGEPCAADGCGCGLPTIDGLEIECERYSTAGAATVGHAKFCAAYGAKEQ